MDRGLYVIASGMLAELTQQERIANDLANASTPGYKSEHGTQSAFADILVRNATDGSVIGTGGLGVVPGETELDLRQGPLRRTDEPLDIGLDGDGFLAVETAQGTRYTRNGQLRVDGEGRLVTANGNAVLDEDGKPLLVPTGGTLEIGADGTVSSAGKAVGSLAVVSLGDPVKVGDSLYAGTPGKRPEGTAVRQGMLEGSNVSAAETMVAMIASLRAFEAGQRVLHSVDETLSRAISVGAVGGA